MNSIREGFVDPELESGRRLVMGLGDEAAPGIEAAPVINADEGNAVVDGSAVALNPTPVSPSANSAVVKKGKPVAPAPTISGEDFVYNLKIVLTPGGAQELEAFCFGIRSGIMRRENRKQPVGLQTLAQYFFDQLMSDNKFRTEVQSDLEGWYLGAKKESNKKQAPK